MIGGAPRTGKTILGQRLAGKHQLGWISTDILMDLLRVKGEDDVQTKWDAAPEAVAGNAEYFFPYLRQFVWSVNARFGSYLIEGVHFLPAQVAQLETEFQIRSVFLGCSEMSLDRLDQFPGHSRGYAFLPDDVRNTIIADIPPWSDLVQQQAKQYGYTFIDMIDDFPSRLNDAEEALEFREESS
jgi:hypothetical protein